LNREDVLAKYLNDEDDVHLQLIKCLYESPAKVSIVPLQDILGLGNEARMNVPGVAEGNWKWRVESHLLTRELAHQVRDLALESGRIATRSELEL
jgi:4-alpha-glucanotransferase